MVIILSKPFLVLFYNSFLLRLYLLSLQEVLILMQWYISLFLNTCENIIFSPYAYFT